MQLSLVGSLIPSSSSVNPASLHIPPPSRKNCGLVCCRKQLSTIGASHFKESGHDLALQLNEAASPQLFCHRCKDIIYNALESHDANVSRRGSKRRRSDSNADDDDTFKCPTLYKSGLPIPPHLVGLRGMTNMGNTCFMNSVIQALVHVSPLRKYFLSNQHRAEECKVARSAISSAAGGETGSPDRCCLGCCVEELFSEMYEPVEPKLPFTPSLLLYSVWNFARHMAGYEQQDAHEFLIAFLNGLHAHTRLNALSGLPSPKFTMNGKSQCKCIVHEIFSGVLQSNVTCASCDETSSVFDPCFDISLDIARLPKPSSIDTVESLDSCLQRFVLPEKLSDEWVCSKCTEGKVAYKTLTFRSLPSVYCFHLKRFEHDVASNTRKKITAFVEFPVQLDMLKFMSDSKRQRKPVEPMLFNLLAVIVHTGSIDTGHYIVFVKGHSGGWFKCNDELVTSVSQQEVLRQEAYLLFYQRTKAAL